MSLYAFSEVENDLVRKRLKIPLTYDSLEARMKYATKKINEINDFLCLGYSFKKDGIDFIDQEDIDLNSSLFLIQSLYQTIENSGSYLRKKSKGTYRTAVNKAADFFPADFLFNSLTDAHILKLRDSLVV